MQHAWVPGEQVAGQIFRLWTDCGQLWIVLGGIEQGDKSMVGEDGHLDMLRDLRKRTGQEGDTVGPRAAWSIRIGIGRCGTQGTDIAGPQ